MELEALKERCGRIEDEGARVAARLSQLEQQQHEQKQHDLLRQTLEVFCRKMSDVLENPSFETKQRILRLVVDKILVSDEEITIQHMVPISNVRLWRDHYTRKKVSQAINGLKTMCGKIGLLCQLLRKSVVS